LVTGLLLSISEDVRASLFYMYSSFSTPDVQGAGVPITSPQLYSAGTTDDLRQAMMFIAHQFPKAPLHGLGFSVGSNLLTKYVAEEGMQIRLQSGCVLGCVSDLIVVENLDYHIH